jgi:Acetyltransferase (GNAT) domain
MTKTEFCVLSDSGVDRESWLNAWATAGREPFAHPDYVGLFTTEGEQARCAVARTAEGLALLPLILRPIEGEGWASDASLLDATSPYGYGGPFCHGKVPWDELWSGFAKWMSGNDVVSMFGRLALDSSTPSKLLPGASVRSDSDNIIVDLTRSPDEQWQHYEHKVRKNVNKAIRAKLHVEVKQSFTDLKEFSSLYESTMDRRGASSWYYFGLDFFASMTERLDGSYVAAEIRDETNRLVSVELVLCSDKFLYSFLGGTLREAFPYAPNDLLKHAVIDYGRESGRIGYVLGGGYTKGDGIFRYKKSFDPTGNVPFQRLELIADRTAYDSLIAQRLKHERSTDSGARLAAGFFPSYRSQVLLGER